MRGTRFFGVLAGFFLLTACSPVSFSGHKGDAGSVTMSSESQQSDQPLTPDQVIVSSANSFDGPADILFMPHQPDNISPSLFLNYRVIYKVLDENSQALPFKYKFVENDIKNLKSLKTSYVDNTLYIDVQATGHLEGGLEFLIKYDDPSRIHQHNPLIVEADGRVCLCGGAFISSPPHPFVRK